MEMMKAARLHAIGDFRADTVAVPQVHGEELLVRVGACGICGSDIPRIFDHGTSNQKYPMVIGHEFSGTVVAVGEKADPALIGKRGAIFPLIPCRSCDMCQIGKYVMCSDYDYLGSRRDGGFAEYMVIPAKQAFHVPDGVSLDTAALCEPLACVVRGVIERTSVKAGDYVLVSGCGVMGQLTAMVAKLSGAIVFMTGLSTDEKRLETARKIGVEAVIMADVTDPEEELKKLAHAVTLEPFSGLCPRAVTEEAALELLSGFSAC